MTVAPLVLGGNVFGWTVDEKTSFDLLDGFVDAGFNAIDTADIYSAWVDGHPGGESETVIGRWLRANPGKRERVLLLTKVGGTLGGDRRGLSERWITRAVEDSLRRLQTDRIDLYQAHWPDPGTPMAETLGTLDKLVRAGKVRAIGCCNLDEGTLAAFLRAARRHGLPCFQTLQIEYNLCARRHFEGGLRRLAIREGLGILSHSSLARGFLSGKYRSRADLAKSPRGKDVARHLNTRAARILHALDLVAARHAAVPAEVALAWLLAREGLTAPIASVTNREQLASLVKAGQLPLAGEDLRLLGPCQRGLVGPDRAGAVPGLGGQRLPAPGREPATRLNGPGDSRRSPRRHEKSPET